jgi:hypothetical protein
LDSNKRVHYKETVVYPIDLAGRGGEIFYARPDQPWNPPSLLYNGYRVFPGGNAAGAIYKWKPYERRPKGRPRLRWEDDARNDLRKTGVKNWKQRAQERKKWKEIIEQAKTHKEL